MGSGGAHAVSCTLNMQCIGIVGAIDTIKLLWQQLVYALANISLYTCTVALAEGQRCLF